MGGRHPLVWQTLRTQPQGKTQPKTPLHRSTMPFRAKPEPVQIHHELLWNDQVRPVRKGYQCATDPIGADYSQSWVSCVGYQEV